jgi:hypothetical protein
VLRPIGVPTFAIVIILCGMMLWVALDPSIYYMMIHWFLLLLLWEIGGGIVFVRLSLRTVVRVPHARDTSRVRAIVIVLLITSALVMLQIPLYAEFFLARAGLNQWVREIDNGSTPAPPSSRRIGPFTVALSTYGDEHTFFFSIGDGGGFAYHPGNDELSGYYNSGADGQLFGKWYWWTDD